MDIHAENEGRFEEGFVYSILSHGKGRYSNKTCSHHVRHGLFAGSLNSTSPGEFGGMMWPHVWVPIGDGAS